MVLHKGILIVLEGIDGAGKSTQAEMLREKLKRKGLNAVYFCEPSKSKWGREIKRKALSPDSLSPEEELDLFQKDRKENVEKNLRPALEERKVVILDRYYYSTIAYQGAKGIDLKRIRRINEEFVIKPDLVFILDIDPRKGLERIEGRKKKEKLFERKEYLIKVRKIFKNLKGKNFRHIDAQRAVDAVSKEIEKIVLDLLKKACVF
jgi:dTMP kinase